MSELNNFKADVTSANYVIEKFHENPGKFASVVLRMYWDMENQCKQYKANNDRLIRRNQILEQYRINHDDVRSWARDMLEINKNDQTLIGLLFMLDHVEKRLYKGRDK